MIKCDYAPSKEACRALGGERGGGGEGGCLASFNGAYREQQAVADREEEGGVAAGPVNIRVLSLRKSRLKSTTEYM